uniref:ABC transporter permease n=1 Tax=Staphylothermus marinus TaxID=2280 RepID=A0A7C4D815_STAMA
MGSIMKALIHKELIDLLRDRKTIITTILLPVITFPLLGFIVGIIYSQQPVRVAIVDADKSIYTDPLTNITVSSEWLVNNITSRLEKMKFEVEKVNSIEAIKNPIYDVVVLIPENFSINASSLNKSARVIIYRRAVFQSAQIAEAAVNDIIRSYSDRLSNLKIKALSRLANVTVSEQAIKNPISGKTEVVTLTGEAAPSELESKGVITRLLIMVLSFVVVPASSFVIDGIIGERERKTIEFLLVSPASLNSIIYSKMIVATLLGLIVAVVDAFSVMIYFVVAATVIVGNVWLFIDIALLAIHSITAFFTILASVSIALPFITRTRGIRSASNIASIVTSIGTIIFLSSFFIDYSRLPITIQYPLYLIPFVHSVLAIQLFLLGEYVKTTMHLALLGISSIILLIITTKTVDSEKILVAPE